METTSRKSPRDTIPRLQHLTYLQTVLGAIEEQLPFDRIRQRISEEARVMSRRAESSGSLIGDAFVHWSTTKDALTEGMKLGLIERLGLPSKRTHVDSHRSQLYTLTVAGKECLKSAGESPTAFRRNIGPKLIASHPYYQALLDTLRQHPIALRNYSEEELRDEKKRSPLWIDRIAEDIARHSELTMSLPATSEAVDVLAKGIREGLGRRFPSIDGVRPKEVLETVDDLVCTLTLRRLGLQIDAISFNVLMSWSRWLYLADESRYVLDLPGRVIWSAADVDTKPPVSIAWRGLAQYGARVAQLLPEVYRDLARSEKHPAGAAPLLSIHSVRATLAFRSQVAIPVVDRVLAQIADGERAVEYDLRLAVAGAAVFPASEPPFMLGNSPYFVLTLHPKPPE